MRDPKPRKDKLPKVDETKLEKFASGADSESTNDEKPWQNFDPTEARKFKSITVEFNEYEHTVFMTAAKKAGYKSAKQFLRESYLARSLHVLEGQPYGSG